MQKASWKSDREKEMGKDNALYKTVLFLVFTFTQKKNTCQILSLKTEQKRQP